MKYKRFFLYFLICGFLFFLLWSQLDNQKYIKLIYWGLSEEEIFSDKPIELKYVSKSGEQKQAVVENWSPDDVWSHYYEVYYYFPNDVEQILDMQIQLVTQEKSEFGRFVASLKSLELYQNNLQIQKIGPFQLEDMFTSNTSWILDGAYIRYISDDEDSIFIQASDEMTAQMNACIYSNRAAEYNIAFFCAVCFVVFLISDYRRRDIINKIKGIPASWKSWSRQEYLFLFLLLNIGVAVAIVAFRSDFCAHPDEYVHRMAIDYYLGKWIPPQGNEAWLAGTFSPYGTSRLLQSTWYYFFAGKLGWFAYQFFAIERYYRILNLLTFGCLLYVVWKKRKTDFWLTAVICISPQLWYTFSYAASDAWDYLWNILAMYLILSPGGLMNKLIYQKDVKGKLIRCIGAGIVFSMVLLGKRNFYFILLCVFIDLLIKWIKVESNQKKRVLYIYLFVLCITFGLTCAKEKLPNIVTASTDEIPANTAESFVVYDLNEATFEESTTGLNLQRKGVSLYDVMFNISHASFFRALYSSTLGVYSMHAFWSSSVYFITMILLYAVLYCSAYSKKKMWNEWIQFFSTPIFLILLTAVVLLWSWKVDYQPTGRYIFSIFPIFAWSLSVKKDIWKTKLTTGVVYLCMLLGLYSFWSVCIWNMVINI